MPKEALQSSPNFVISYTLQIKQMFENIKWFYQRKKKRLNCCMDFNRVKEKNDHHKQRDLTSLEPQSLWGRNSPGLNPISLYFILNLAMKDSLTLCL